MRTVTCDLSTERKAGSCAARRLEDACNGRSAEGAERRGFRVRCKEACHLSPELFLTNNNLDHCSKMTLYALESTKSSEHIVKTYYSEFLLAPQVEIEDGIKQSRALMQMIT